ncbi:MAG: cytochrome-c peroxidase [Candidatus Electrothrix aestuarii]|uniref:Cytochrome-c peroxidase n=1 Tax=Candidatus Electrothrix aestuarii TaxID=3062594 RepID=A0AAU8LSM0_9BACT|nr:cytochrome-c peroxidase [Candidatus Electrothrix aestuarii]
MKKTAGALFLACAVLATGAVQAEQKPVEPITPATGINKEKAELGKKLFFDPRLSKSGFISCNSCHNLSRGGTDNLQTSIGHNWQQGPINAPTVLNSSMNFVQFWDGRAKDLKDQAGGPIANPGEMAFTHSLAEEVLQSIPGYVVEFKGIYGKDKIDIEQVTDAIAEFEKTLVTPNSRFDQWLQGDKNALNADEQAGYKVFQDSGCISCHYGMAMGGGNFYKMGMVEEFKAKSPSKGRQDVTGKEEHHFMFKVPTLRNVELTYPYFHDGSAQTLSEAVDTMARHQLGKKFSREENAQLVAFLKTLTGEQPTFTIPILPPSSDTTPRPRPFE